MSATALDRTRGLGLTDKLLVALSISCGLIYLVTTGLRPYAGSVVIKALSVSPLALVAFRLLRDRDGWLLGAALLFSSAGDVFLGVDGDGLFIYGLGSFLIAHLLYTALFARSRPRPLAARPAQWSLMAALVLYSGALGAWLYPSLGDLSLPVVAYVSAITLMGLSAILAGFRTRWVIVGALLFIISDSLIGVTRFKTALGFGDYLIWATYYAGQAGIALGFLREKSRIA
jgi:alkenylglycerophosphocholine/alkenylglycerophosphoethanolamine hydrolase